MRGCATFSTKFPGIREKRFGFSISFEPLDDKVFGPASKRRTDFLLSAVERRWAR